MLVPEVGADVIVTWPFARLTIACTVASPSPDPLSADFVVKNGSNAR